ncbi:carbonic anhydrase [Rhizobium sp. BK512]|nr:carbonic anhydrase [Rhizobium sp. BK379]MBB3565527.1 carbonic anhydrase [Rhizobium sp. BK512]
MSTDPTSDEDHRQLRSSPFQLAQFDAGHASEIDIQHETVDRRFHVVTEKSFRRCIFDSRKSVGIEEPTHAST